MSSIERRKVEGGENIHFIRWAEPQKRESGEECWGELRERNVTGLEDRNSSAGAGCSGREWRLWTAGPGLPCVIISKPWSLEYSGWLNKLCDIISLSTLFKSMESVLRT